MAPASGDMYFKVRARNTNVGQNFEIAYRNLSIREIEPRAITIGMRGKISYEDANGAFTVVFLQQGSGANPTLRHSLATSGTREGQFWFQQIGNENSAANSSPSDLTPGNEVPFAYIVTHGDNVNNAGVSGISYPFDFKPSILPGLQGLEMRLAEKANATIEQFVIWVGDPGDEARENWTE